VVPTGNKRFKGADGAEASLMEGFSIHGYGFLENKVKAETDEDGVLDQQYDEDQFSAVLKSAALYNQTLLETRDDNRKIFAREELNSLEEKPLLHGIPRTSNLSSLSITTLAFTLCITSIV
jgi:hypothetical protein